MDQDQDNQLHHHLDDTPATAETIIHALSQFREENGHHGDQAETSGEGHPYSSLSLHDLPTSADQGLRHGSGGPNDLGNMSRRDLEAEVLKLRGLVSLDAASSSTGDDSGTVKRPRASESATSRTVSRNRRTDRSKGKEVDKVRSVDTNTGKRMEKERRTELYKAIRDQASRTRPAVSKTSGPDE
jgi:hypothetical protein